MLAQDPAGYSRSAENVSPEKLKEMVLKSRGIEIDSIDCEHFNRLEDWFADVQELMAGQKGGDASGREWGGGGCAGDGPSGEGWVVQIVGHHYHNQAQDNEVGPNMSGKRCCEI